MVVELDVLRVVIGVSFLAWAAALDVRTRRVRNAVWVAMGSAGLVLSVAQLVAERDPATMYLVLVPLASSFFPVFYGKELRDEQGWHVAPGHISAYGAGIAAATLGWSLLPEGELRARFLAFLAAAAMVVVFRAFYEVNLIRGGADAKALMAVALLVPTYPGIPGLPVLAIDPRLRGSMDLLFPFAFLVLLDAALAFVVAPLALLAYNVAKGDAKLPEALFGMRKPLDHLPKFAWLMDRIIDGEHAVVLMPRRDQDRETEVAALRAAGFRSAWVTPQVPFVVAIAAGFFAAVLLGNPILAAVPSLR